MRTHVFSVLLTIALLAPAAPFSRAGDIAGRITIDPAPDAPATAPKRSSPEPAPAPQAIVYVEAVEPPAGGFSWPAELEAPRIEMQALAFRPREVVVKKGGTVAFENGDDLFHQPFSCSRGNRFDLGRFRKGESPEVTFAEPGVARVYCDVHAGMRAFVLVVENPYYARVAPDGTFRIAGVPPGRRRLAVLFEGDVLARREVEVGAAGELPALDWRVAAATGGKDGERTAAMPVRCCVAGLDGAAARK